MVFTEPDRRRLLTTEGPGGGGERARGESKGAWTIYDSSNNLVRQDWASMINRSLRAASQTSGRKEATSTDGQVGLTKLKFTKIKNF